MDYFSSPLSMIGLGALASLVFLLLAVWSVAWKGVALWIAARENSKPWFVVLLIVNTAGILEIVYLVFFSKMGGDWISGWQARRAAKKGRSKAADPSGGDTEQPA